MLAIQDRGTNTQEFGCGLEYIGEFHADLKVSGINGVIIQLFKILSELK